MDNLDDMGVSKLSAKVFLFFFKVNYSFKEPLSWIFENDCSYGVKYSSKGNILQRFISESAPYIKLLSFKSESRL